MPCNPNHHTCIPCIAKTLKARGTPITGSGVWTMKCPICRQASHISISTNTLSNLLCNLPANQPSVPGLEASILMHTGIQQAQQPVDQAQWESEGEWGHADEGFYEDAPHVDTSSDEDEPNDDDDEPNDDDDEPNDDDDEPNDDDDEPMCLGSPIVISDDDDEPIQNLD